MCGFNHLFDEFEFIRYSNTNDEKITAIQTIITLLRDNGVKSNITEKIAKDYTGTLLHYMYWMILAIFTFLNKYYFEK